MRNNRSISHFIIYIIGRKITKMSSDIDKDNTEVTTSVVDDIVCRHPVVMGIASNTRRNNAKVRSLELKVDELERKLEKECRRQSMKQRTWAEINKMRNEEYDELLGQLKMLNADYLDLSRKYRTIVNDFMMGKIFDKQDMAVLRSEGYLTDKVEASDTASVDSDTCDQTSVEETESANETQPKRRRISKG